MPPTGLDLVAGALVRGGVRVVEVALNAPEALIGFAVFINRHEFRSD